MTYPLLEPCPRNNDFGIPYGTTVKNLPAKQKMWVQSLGWEDPLEEEMATHAVFLPGESHGQGSLAGCSSWGPTELDVTERVTLSLFKDNSGRDFFSLHPFIHQTGYPQPRTLAAHSGVCTTVLTSLEKVPADPAAALGGIPQQSQHLLSSQQGFQCSPRA